MRRILIPTLMVVVATAAFAGDFIPASRDAVESSYLVTFDESNSAAVAAPQAASAHGATVARIYRAALNGAHLINLPESAARTLANQQGVLRVEQDGIVQAVAVQNNPPSWGLDRIDQRNLPLDDSYTFNFDGTGVDVYILDTGMRATHNDFGGRATLDFDSIGDGQNGNDCHGHGTHVGGTAGGSSFGVAKNVSLHAVRVLDCSGSGTFAGVIAGIDFVTQEAIDNPNALIVANMSLSGGANATLNDAVDTGSAVGVVHVVAAGNDATDACSFSPASAATAFTIAATEINDNRASFSNFGTCVDLFAPGVGITSAWFTSDTATATINGTSMSSPHVAGAAALIREEFPAFSVADVKAELLARATAGVVSNPGPGSPNLLLFTLGLGGCTVDADCDDGLFCNGAEVCSAGTCAAGTAPNCGDGVSCTDDSCNEATDSCDNVANDAQCDNGLFCDGSELCDAILDCQPASDPCGTSEFCNETIDTCVEDIKAALITILQRRSREN